MLRQRWFVLLVVVVAGWLVLSVSVCFSGSAMFRGGPQRTGRVEHTGPGAGPVELVWSYDVGSWICSTAALDEASDIVVFGANDHKVYALSLSGEFLWSYETGDCVYSSPLLAWGRVFVGSADGNLYAFSTAGSLLWRYETDGPIFSSPVAYTSAQGRQTVAFGSDDGRVYAVGPDGVALWSYDAGSWVTSSPAVSVDGDLYFASYSGKLFALDSAGSFKWSFDAGSKVVATPAVGPDGGIVLGTLGGTMLKVSSAGSLVWSYEADGPIFGSCAIDSAGGVRFGIIGHRFYYLNQQGKLLSRYGTATPFPKHYCSSPLVDKAGRTYFGTMERRLICLNNDGDWVWTREMGNGVYASPVLDAQGRLYIGCLDGVFYCFAGSGQKSAGSARVGRGNRLTSARPFGPGAPAGQGQEVRFLAPEVWLDGPAGNITLLDEALKMIGYSYGDIAVVQAPLQRDPYRLDLVEQLLSGDPVEAPVSARESADEFEQESLTFQSKIIQAAALGDVYVEPTSLSWEFGPNPLEEAIREVYRRHQKSLTPQQEAELGRINERVDSALQRALGLLLLAIDDANRLRDESLQPLSESERARLFDEEINPNLIGNTSPLFSMFEVYEKIDRAKLFAGAALVASVIDSFIPIAVSGQEEASQGPAPRSGGTRSASGDVIFSMETPIGSIVLGGPGQTTYTTPPDHSPTQWPALIVDLGGNDKYYNYLPPEIRDRVCVSVSIDVSGDDIYSTSQDSAQGSGDLGVGFCLDLGGDDVYKARNYSQGAGWGGVGVLYDASGNDQYYGGICCQAAGYMGVGLLIDGSGSDQYSVDEFGQAFGYIRGVGILDDLSGDDLYFAGGEYVHQYEPPRTTSMSQGYGFGVRLHMLGEPHASGGIGLLVDSGGDDTYVSDFFGTGGAYWFGLGMLLDREGDDSYFSRQYSIGSGIHYAVGVVIDDDGSDSYMCRALSEGCAHDNSVGILVDNAGDDTYIAQDFSQGASDGRSFAILVDNGGNDFYWAMAGRLNQGEGKYRSDVGQSSLGFLFDVGGVDWYQLRGSDNTRWTSRSFGVGIDVPFGDSGFH